MIELNQAPKDTSLSAMEGPILTCGNPVELLVRNAFHSFIHIIEHLYVFRAG